MTRLVAAIAVRTGLDPWRLADDPFMLRAILDVLRDADAEGK